MTEMVKSKLWSYANTCQSLNFELFTLTCLIHANDKSPGLIRLQGYRGVFFQRAFRTTETVTVRQLTPFILNCTTEMSSFFGPKLKSGLLLPRGHMLLSFCYFSWFRPSQHSHGNGNICYQVLIDDPNFGRLLVSLTVQIQFDVFLLYICHFVL